MFFERTFKYNCSTARKEKNTKNKIKRINQDLIADVGKEVGNHFGKTCRPYEVGHSIFDFGCVLKKVDKSSFAYEVTDGRAKVLSLDTLLGTLFSVCCVSRFPRSFIYFFFFSHMDEKIEFHGSNVKAL